MPELRPRDTQTRVKHEILSRYLDTWGGIIVNGLRSRKYHPRRFVYVDCFSSLGLYAGEREDFLQNRETQHVDGSPLIGIKALDKLYKYAKGAGIEISVNSILVEENEDTFLGLKDTLSKASFGHRVKETQDYITLQKGQISIVNADAISIVDNLVSYTSQPDTWAFYLLDPFGPSGIPYDFVSKIVGQENHDVMVNFIYEDLLRKTGMCLREDLEPKHQQLVDNWSTAFGSGKWKEIVREILLAEEEDRGLRDALGEYGEGIVLSIEQLRDLKEERLVFAYRDVLRSMDTTLVTKLVNLKFSDKERTMFYLYLTTHDPTGALGLNKILFDAKFLEFELRYRLKIAKKTAPPPGQWTLFPVEIQVPEYWKPPRPTPDEIEEEVMKRFTKQTLTRRDVYRELVNTDYFPTEVDQAIRHLRKSGKVKFEGKLNHRTLVSFE
jgi:three-Cys-motif partner protein